MAAGSPRLFPIAQEQLTSDDYYTPAWVFERMGLTFDLDVAAPPGGVEWIPATRYYTQADDGLLQPWTGRVWMNPPYSQPEPFVERFMAHGHGVALLPMSNGRWFHRIWSDADAVALLAERATEFVGGGIPIRTCLMAYGDECVDAISHLGAVRRIA